MSRIPLHEILVILFGRVESPQRYHFCDDRLLKHLGIVKRPDIGFGRFFLVVIRVKNDGPVLGTDVGSLVV
jgi:hypothetical protein